MMSYASINKVSKRFGQHRALDGVSLEIPQGGVLGLIGPNGAGKTTLLKAMLGLSSFEGEIDILGRSPRRSRHELMQSVGYISDVGILPSWMRVDQIIQLSASVHPNFSELKAWEILEHTQIQQKQKIKTLSKGMITQLHLSLVLAMDVKLLILDEPTLGLDIVYRSQFYQQLLETFLDGTRTLVISTHQVEEIESLLTHLVFIEHGRLRLSETMDDVFERFSALDAPSASLATVRSLGPLSETPTLTGASFIFDSITADALEGLGERRRVGIAELFVGMMGPDLRSVS